MGCKVILVVPDAPLLIAGVRSLLLHDIRTSAHKLLSVRPLIGPPKAVVGRSTKYLHRFFRCFSVNLQFFFRFCAFFGIFEIGADTFTPSDGLRATLSSSVKSRGDLNIASPARPEFTSHRRVLPTVPAWARPPVIECDGLAASPWYSVPHVVCRVRSAFAR